MEKKRFVLGSSPVCYTPGIVKWACALRKRDVKGARSDIAARRSFLRRVFPGLTPAALTALVEGRYTVDETAETVTVEG
jgi:hypothetical protein